MFLMAVLLASTLPVVAPVLMSASISIHHRQTVPVCLRPRGCLDQFLEFDFHSFGVFQGSGAQQGPEMFLYLARRLEGAVRIVGGEHFFEPEGCPAAEGVAAAQQEHPVRPCLVDGPAAPALDLLGKVLPGLCHCLVGQ